MVAPLEPAQRARFVAAWYTALIRDTGQAAARATDLIARVEANPRLRQLATTPIMLTVMAIVHQTKGALPERRAELYELCVAALAERWDASREVTPDPCCPSLTLDRKRAIFQELALAAHQLGEDGPPLEPDDCQRLIRAALEPAAAAELEPEHCRRLLEQPPSGPTRVHSRLSTPARTQRPERLTVEIPEDSPWSHGGHGGAQRRAGCGSLSVPAP